MRIINKQGIFQIEDWSDHCKVWPYTIGCFPIATRNGVGGLWYTLGKPIRITIEFKCLGDAQECFHAMASGEKQIKDYSHAIANKIPLSWIN
jgi:hypothetical protein